MSNKPLYRVEEATIVLVQIAGCLPQEKLDELIALYCHGRFGNYDESSNAESWIISSAAKQGLPPIRPQAFQLWKRIYRRAHDSAVEFVIKCQTEERRIYGTNELYNMLRSQRI
jgi:hypothetical protein